MGAAMFPSLQVTIDRAVASVRIDHPPMNLLDADLLSQLDQLGRLLESDARVRVIVFRSGDPDFFIAHGDVNGILQLPERVPPAPAGLPWVHQVLDRYRSMSKVTIAQIEGFARGGGSEFCLACDMRFAALGRAVFGQPEIGLGIIPGAGGTARLARLVGRARACEIVLSGADYSAAEAERYGWINRALPPEELAPYVDHLACRIASFPAIALAQAKSVINAASIELPSALIGEQIAFDQCVADPERRRRMTRFLELGCQTRAGEASIGDDLERL
jgi:enoyl-CoA hydratase/carnithine racemase